jgi:predicted aspartyl protease
MATAELRDEEETIGRILTEVGLANNRDVQLWKAGFVPAEKVRRTRIQAVIDTGANHLVLPTAVAESLGLPKAGELGVRYADGRSARRETVDQLELELLGRTGTFRASLEPDRTTVLVGAIVLEDFDLLVDCGKQIVYPRDPDRIITEIE